jgi:hypothetical protein
MGKYGDSFEQFNICMQINLIIAILPDLVLLDPLNPSALVPFIIELLRYFEKMEKSQNLEFGRFEDFCIEEL